MSMNILEYESMEVYTCILPYSCTVILTYIYCMARIMHIKVAALTVSEVNNGAGTNHKFKLKTKPHAICRGYYYCAHVVR